MQKNLFPFLLLLLSFALAACGTPQYRQPADPLLPMPEGYYGVVEDPDERLLMAAVEDYLKHKGAPLFTRYEFSRIDLDNDTRRDAIVLMKTPNQYWCSFNGCRLAVFKAHNEGFELISEIEPVRGPLLVTEEETNGWRDIVVRISGRTHWEAKNVALKFDGRSYPAKPEFEPELMVACNEETSVKLFP